MAPRDGRTILEAAGRPGELGAHEPLADGFIGDAEGGGGGAAGRAGSEMMLNQFGSHAWSKCGISVHSDPEG